MPVRKMKAWLDRIHAYADHWWYGPILGLIAAFDFIVFVVPIDAIVIAAATISPKRWWSNTFCVALGSSLGAVCFAAFLEAKGLPFLVRHFPDIQQGHAWVLSEHLVHKYGSFAVWILAISPIILQPVLAMAAFSKISLWKVLFLVLAGRLPKYGFYSWLASHAPEWFARWKRKKA